MRAKRMWAAVLVVALGLSVGLSVGGDSAYASDLRNSWYVLMLGGGGIELGEAYQCGANATNARTWVDLVAFSIDPAFTPSSGGDADDAWLNVSDVEPWYQVFTIGDECTEPAPETLGHQDFTGFVIYFISF